jgi:hypothetical protein
LSGSEYKILKEPLHRRYRLAGEKMTGQCFSFMAERRLGRERGTVKIGDEELRERMTRGDDIAANSP